MTAPTPVGFLDFFILEASDYVEQLDGLLDAGGAAGPDTDSLQRVARALRGSATMAKLGTFSELAGGVERVARALREGALAWDSSLSAVIVAAVDECKLLLRNVRTWGDVEEARARSRISELTGYAAVRVPTPLASPTLQGHDSYLATEASNIGAGLELLATRPTDRDSATNVLRRVRALRGIASVKDHPALADVLEAAEQAAHPLELGEPSLSAERVALLQAAATVLRGVASAIRTGGETEAAQPDLAKFATALDAMRERAVGTDRVVPISDLFYHDGGPTVVETSPNPPTTPQERFRLEAVSQGEHLRRLVSDARSAHDELARERVRRGLRVALRSLQQSAESFGETDVGQFVASHNDAAMRLDGIALDSLDEVATLLAQPGAMAGSIGDRLGALKIKRASVPTPIVAMETVPQRAPAPSSPSAMTPIAPMPSVPEPRPVETLVAAAAALAAPAAAKLGDLLDAGISRLGSLASAPLSAPAAIPEQPAVAIDVLLYRGRAAIERCREIRDDARAKGVPLQGAALDEMYDLLDLALTN